MKFLTNSGVISSNARMTNEAKRLGVIAFLLGTLTAGLCATVS